MERIGMFDAKTRFSEIVRRVRRSGKAILITSRGEVVAQIAPVPVEPAERKKSREEAIAAVHELWKTLPKTTREENQRDLESGRR